MMLDTISKSVWLYNIYALPFIKIIQSMMYWNKSIAYNTFILFHKDVEIMTWNVFYILFVFFVHSSEEVQIACAVTTPWENL